jgi:endonuclease YncB( thermonuclease family)
MRLAGIDAPESDQSCTDSNNHAWLCGRAATQAIIANIAGRPLKCETSGLARSLPPCARGVLAAGRFRHHSWMVRQGWALACYSEAYRAEENNVHAAGRGIWAGSFMPPWEWRHRHQHWWMR